MAKVKPGVIAHNQKILIMHIIFIFTFLPSNKNLGIVSVFVARLQPTPVYKEA